MDNRRRRTGSERETAGGHRQQRAYKSPGDSRNSRQGYYDGGDGYYNEGDGYGRQGYYDEEGGYSQQGYYDDEGGYGQQGYYDEGDGYGRQEYYEEGGYRDTRRGSYARDYGNGSQGYYEERSGRGRKKKHRKWVLALEIILLLVIALGIFVFSQIGRIDREKLHDILVNTGIGVEGYRNIALFGVDSRTGELESGTNSDTIMVCSINNKTGKITLASVYRDTYLDITNGTYSKANSAYAGGGAERAVNMLNKNLDLDITDFVTVDFNAVIEAVDLLGGIDIELTDEEVTWLNAYLVETSQVTGKSYENVAGPGMQHLSGIQAMAYCRIRYTTGWDYKRTERQRLVLEKIFEKAQQQGVTGLAGMITTMFDYIKTSLSTAEILSLAANIGRYEIGDTIGFPYEKQGANIAAGDCVVPVNLAANVSQLHADLFGDTSYTPSQTVQEISNKIINDTGIQ